jgi:hypothetical protein
MRITGKQLRQIIKEEVSRSMNEMGSGIRVSTQREVMPTPPAVYPLSVAVNTGPNEVEDAIQSAIDRAMGDYPDYEFDLKTGGRYGAGFMVRRSPSGADPRIAFTVYLEPSKRSMTQDDLDDMPGGERLNYERELSEGMGRGASFLVSEFIDLNGGIEELRSAYGNGEDAVAAITSGLNSMIREMGYSASPMEVADAAVEIARMMGARRRAISKRYYEEEIEDPYGPEY